MSWKKKNGVLRLEGEHASAKITQVEDKFNLKMLNKVKGEWIDGYTGDLDACKTIGERLIKSWGEAVEKREDIFKQRREASAEFDKLPENEKAFVRCMRLIVNLPKDKRAFGISQLPEDWKQHAIDFCNKSDEIKGA